ncbi:MAG TPA: hypothetical protein VHI13_10985 [Candidatus Kapabacteria bacterium]|nr:hypothetical protein [Candidatus Kapabacteria bacterium]
MQIIVRRWLRIYVRLEREAGINRHSVRGEHGTDGIDDGEMPMNPNEPYEGTEHALRLGRTGAAISLCGLLLSGPIGMAVVAAVQSQPEWQGARNFVQHFHPIQIAPFLFGFALVGGSVALMAAVHVLGDRRHRARTVTALIFTATFAAFIFFNYLTQTAFVPSLAGHYSPESDPIISTFTLSNPRSLSWGIEMWGYALLGVATWLAAPVFNRGGIERACTALMVANGAASIAGAAIVVIDPGWLLNTAGMVCFIGWNILYAAMLLCIMRALRSRAAMPAGAAMR